MAAVRQFEFAIFWYFVTRPSLEPKSAAAHQISLKSDDPLLRYSDETIFKMSAIRYLEFSELLICSLDLCLSLIVLQHSKFRVNRTIINRRFIIVIIIYYLLKYDFQYGGSHWICCDVIILHLRTLFHVLNIVSNFQVHWFSSFWYTWTFMFHHFGLKLLFWGQNLTFLG